MKKIASSICLTLLFAGFSVAQDAATIAPPAAPTPDVSPVAEVVEAAAAEVARPADAPAAVEQVVVDAAPVAVPAAVAPVEITLDQGTVLNQGTVLDQGIVLDQGTVVQAAPEYTQGQVLQGEVYSENQVIGTYGDSVMAPAVSYDQSVVASQPAPVVNAEPFAAPFAAPAMAAPAPTALTAAPACVNCESNSRRQVLRTVTTRSRSMFTRVRGLIGRRR